MISINISTSTNQSQNISLDVKQGITLYTVSEDILGQKDINKTQYILPQNTSNQICQELLQTSELLICKGYNTQLYYIQKDQIDEDQIINSLELKDAFREQQQLNVLGIKDDIIYILSPPQQSNQQYQICGYQIDNECQLEPKYVFKNQTIAYIEKLIENLDQPNKIYFASQNKDQIFQFSATTQTIDYQFNKNSQNNKTYTVQLLYPDDIYNIQTYAQTGSQSLYQSVENQYSLMVLQNKFYRNQIFFDNNLIVTNLLQDDLRFCLYQYTYFESTDLTYQDLQIDKDTYLPEEIQTISFKIKNSLQCNYIQIVFQNGANIYANYQQDSDGSMYVCQTQIKVPVKAKNYNEYLVLGSYKLQGQEKQIAITHDQPQNIIQAMISPSIIRTNNTFKARLLLSDKYQNRIYVDNDEQCENIYAAIYVLNGTSKYSEISPNNTFFYKNIQFKKENNVCIFEDGQYDAQKYAILINFNEEIKDQEEEITYQHFSTSIGQSLIFTVSQIPEVFKWGALQILNIFAYIIFMLFIMILLPYILYYFTERNNILLRKQEKAEEKAKQQLAKKEKSTKQEEKIEGLGKIQVNGKNLYNNEQYIDNDSQLKDIQLADEHIKQLLEKQNWIQSKYSKYIYLENCKYNNKNCNIHIAFSDIEPELYQKQIIFYQNLNIKLINQRNQEKIQQNQQTKKQSNEQQISQAVSSTMPMENASTESLTNISQQQQLNISSVVASQATFDPTVVDFNTSVPVVYYQDIDKVNIQKIIIFNTNKEENNIILKTLQEIYPNQDVVLTIFESCNYVQQSNLPEEALQQLKQVQNAFYNMNPHRIFEQLQDNIFQNEEKVNTIILGIPPAQNEKYLIYGIKE